MMGDGFLILNELSDAVGGNILHGGEVSVEILSEEAIKKYLDGKTLFKAEYALSVFGREQSKVLEKTAAALEAASEVSSFFAFKLCGAQGEYTPEGNYRYTVKFSCKYIV